MPIRCGRAPLSCCQPMRRLEYSWVTDWLSHGQGLKPETLLRLEWNCDNWLDKEIQSGNCSDCDKIWSLPSFIWLCSRSGSNFDGLICICSNDFQPIYLSNISLTFLFFELWRRFSMLLVMCATSITSTFNIWSFLNFLCFWSSYLIPWGIFSLIKYCRKTKCL